MRRSTACLIACLMLSGVILLAHSCAEGAKDEATLPPSVELRQVDGVYVPFQHGEPYPSFEIQRGREYLDLGGAWKCLELGSTEGEISLSLSERNEETISALETPNYHATSFDDNGWAEVVLPTCDNDEHVFWFRRWIEVPSTMSGKYVRLVLLGANYITDLWVNGRYVGWHEGGYTSFFFDVTEFLSYGSRNLIAIRVHNIPWGSRMDQADIIPYRVLDFRNYGGIYRDIYLEAANELHVARVDVKPSLIRVGDRVAEDRGHIDVNVVVYNSGTAPRTAEASLSVYGASVDSAKILDPAPEAIADTNLPIVVSGTTRGSATLSPGGTAVLRFSLDLSWIRLWTPVDPALYVLRVELNGGEENFFTQFGIREIRVDNEWPRLLLNGVPTFLAGIARHESMPDVYRKFTAEQMENLMRDFLNAKEANANFIRTAHYPNHPYLYILADRMGFMIWEELPATWFADRAFEVQMRRGTARQNWLEMICRDYNRPSIIIWSTANEADIYENEPAPGISSRYRFNQELRELAYRIDGTRLVTQATFWNRDPTWPVDDLLGINEYQGVFYYPWAPTIGEYYRQTRDALRSTHEFCPSKPILASETGTWSCGDMSRIWEQVRCWEDTFRALDEKPYVTGITWWCLNDWWQARGTDQTMGAITWDRKTKKDVYYAIKASYENSWTRPWVMITTPEDGALLSDNVTIAARAEDYRGENVGVARVECQIDSGEYVGMRYENGLWITVWNTRDGPDGEHTIRVRVVDGDGLTKTHLITVGVNNLSRWIQRDWSGGACPMAMRPDNGTIAFWSFDVLSGSRVWDDSGNGNHGRIFHAQPEPGRWGNGIRFENQGIDTDDAPHIKIFHRPELDFVSQDFTVELWVMPCIDYPNSEKGWRYFVRQDNKINGDWWDGCWWIGYDEWWDELAFVVRNAEGGEQKAAYRMPLVSGYWYHFAGVKEGTMLKLYVNGELRAIGRGPENYQPSGDLYINYHRANPSDPIYDTFNGIVDEIRIQRGAVSAEEIALHGTWAESGTWIDSYGRYSLGENVETSAQGEVRLSKVGNSPPTAAFTYAPLRPSLADNSNVVNFADASSDSDGAVVSWLWDFGDGSTSTDRNPSHEYTSEGTYMVTLTVADSDGATSVAWDFITVSWEWRSLQNFEFGGATPDNGFYDAWSSRPVLDSSNAHEGSRCLRIQAHGGEGGSHGGTVGIWVAHPLDPVDMQGATFLSIWAYDNVGNNTIELRLIDSDGTIGPAWWSSDHAWGETTGRTVKGRWTEIVWDISDYPAVDMGRIVAIELYVWWDGTYYFDDVSFARESGFRVSASGTADALAQGESRSVEIAVVRIGPYWENVRLSCSGAPEGVDVSFSATEGRPDFSSTMRVSVRAGAVPGIYPITVTGTGGDGRKRSCVYTISVGEQVFQNFEPGNGTPAGYFYNVYYTVPAFDSATAMGSRSLSVRAMAGAGGAHGGTVGVNAASPLAWVNLQNVSLLSAWVYDNVGNNTAELILKDRHGNAVSYGYSDRKSVKGRWTRLTWDLTQARPGVDRSCIVSVEIYEWWDGQYYFDNISFFSTSGFRVFAYPPTGSLARGGSTSVTIGVELAGQYGENVGLRCENVPEGVTVELSRAYGRPNFASTMRIAVGENVGSGIYPITVVGEGDDGTVRTCIYTLAVGEITFQDFEVNNGTPGAYYYDVWQSSPGLDQNTVHGGSRSLRMVAGRGGGTVGIRAASPSGYMDLSRAKTISVWVYDTQGNNTVQLRLRDADGDGGSGADGRYMWSSVSSVQNQWTRITWDLSGYPSVPKLDMDRIASIELYEWNQGIYYFDDLKFVEGETENLENLEAGARETGDRRGGAVLSFADGPHMEMPVLVMDPGAPQATGKDAYRSSGSLTSSVFDAGTTVCWGTVSWDASVPPSTSLRVYVRAGELNDPIVGWTSWKECGNGEDLPFRGRYIQYRVVLFSHDGSATPVFRGIRITYSPREPQMDLLLALLIAVVIIAGALLLLWRKRRSRKAHRD